MSIHKILGFPITKKMLRREPWIVGKQKKKTKTNVGGQIYFNM